MKSLLVKLTLGLYDQDLGDEERPRVEAWLQKGLLVKEGDIYRLPSKYRAGTVALNQNGGGAWLQVLGANVRDLFIDEHDLGGAREGDLAIVQRRLGRRGTPSAKVVEIVGRAESYSVAYLRTRDGIRALLDIRNDHPAGVTVTAQELHRYEEGTLFKIDNRTNEIPPLSG